MINNEKINLTERIQNYFSIDLNKIELLKKGFDLENLNLELNDINKRVQLNQIQNINIIKYIILNSNILCQTPKDLDLQKFCLNPLSMEIKAELKDLEKNSLNYDMISYLKLFNKQKSEAQQLLININKKSNNDIRLDDVKFKFNITTNILDQINKMLELNDLKYNKNFQNNIPALLAPKNELNSFYILFAVKNKYIQPDEIENYLDNDNLVTMLVGNIQKPTKTKVKEIKNYEISI